MRLIIILLLASQSLLAFEDNGEFVEAYKSNYSEIAVAEMYRTGIPASIKLAQGMLESNWGRSELATVANNHFGIKCGRGWEGGEYYREDDDYNKQGELMKSCFRSFENANASYIAHSDFLTDPKKDYRYGFLFDLETTDYKSWARGLKSAGYATDPKYPEKLISIIEKHNLQRFDVSINAKPTLVATETETETEETTETKPTVIASITFPVKKSEPPARPKTNTETTKPASTTVAVAATKLKAATATETTKKESMPARHISTLAYDIRSNNDVRMVRAMGGETLDQLSTKVGVSVDDLLTFNELYLQKEDMLDADAIIYIERKNRKLKAGPEYHIVKDGENMETIAQMYGIRLKSLFAKNRMPKGSATVTGVKLHLKNTASLSERPQFILPDSDRSHTLLFADDPTVN